MYNAGYRRASAVVDVSHRTGDSSRGGYTAKERHDHVRYTLGYELGIGVMLVAYHTVSHHSRQQRLDGT